MMNDLENKKSAKNFFDNLAKGTDFYVIVTVDRSLTAVKAQFVGFNENGCAEFSFDENSESFQEYFKEDFQYIPMSAVLLSPDKTNFRSDGWGDGDDGHSYYARFFLDLNKANEVLIAEITRLSKMLF